MTARAPGGPSRGAAAPTRTSWSRDGVGAILGVLAVLALGLVFRVIIARENPGIGLGFDLGSFRGWASDLATNGLYGFYEREGFHDYTPGYLYVLYLVGLIGQATGGIGDLIKVPAIFADVAIGWLVWSMALELGAGRRAALIGAAIAVANPVSWFDSVIWGQVDSFGVVFLLLGVRALWRDRPERAAIWAVIAALIKPQLGILIPIVAVVTIRRALWPTSDAGVEESDEPLVGEGGLASILDRLRAFERRTDQPVRILTTGLAALAMTFILSAPFGLSVLELRDGTIHSGLVEQVFNTAGGYPYITVNAYNPWALASLDGAGMAATGQWVCDVVITNPVEGGPQCPTAFSFGPVPAVLVGTALLLAAFAAVCAIVARRPDRLTILIGVTVLSIAFFVLPTRVHERYLYPFFALGAILAAVSWRWLAAYAVLSLATFLNMYAVITTIYPDPERGMTDWLGIGHGVTSQVGVSTIALATLVIGVWAFTQLRPAAFAALEADIAANYAGGEDWDGEPESPDPGGGSPAGWQGPSRPRRPAPVAPAAVALPRWTERPSFAEVGLIEWLRVRLNERPLRADRSHDLHDEPAGRLDRLDLWLVVVLVAAILGIRMFRLAEPYQMHFDEVYHARTATEFLQDWRYGISHEIYEYTHPHLAKYAMAVGIVAWGDDRVSATSELGVPVVDAVVEPRRDDSSLPDGRGGDRVHVVTGSELRSYDLEGRQLVFDAPVDGASAVALDPLLDRLFIGTRSGKILTFDLLGLDGVRSLETSALVEPPAAFGSVDGSIRMLYATDDGRTLFVATDDGRLVTLDADSAEQLGSIELPGIAGFAPGGTGSALATLPGSVEDPAAAAALLADLLGGDAAAYEARMTPTDGSSIVAGIGGVDQRVNIDAAIADGRLAGLTIDDVQRVAIATAEGVTYVAGPTGDVVSSTQLDGGAHGIALITNVDDPKLYVSTGGTADGAPGEVAVITVGGETAKNGPILKKTIPLPGPGSRVAYDPATQMVHVLGVAPDGEGSTIYVIETHADAVFADAKLPFEPSAWGIDVAKEYPTADREQILAFDASGEVASVEVGKHAFSWRLPGVIAGALMAGLLFLLARILFRRREVAVLVGIMALADGMLFVQSRIGMNDAYVGLGIVAAYTLFAAIWTGAWRWRGAFWVAMPLIGISLGFALAAKWVALYAIGGLALLVLARSALGRFLLIAGLIFVTAVLGHLAIVVPNGTGFGNLPFVAIMIALTSVAVAVNILHPIAWSKDEYRFALVAPTALGILIALGAIVLGKATSRVATIALPPTGSEAVFLVSPLHVAVLLIASSFAVYAAFVFAGRAGFGPLAVPPDPTDPAALLPPPAPAPTASWLRPGALLGLPIVWMAICLLVIPVGLYIVSYIPWALVEGHRITDTWPPGHAGQTLADLTRAMYDYHNNLTSGHAAASPWWAWPFDLKPVWFYQEGLAGSTTAAIYDAGNLVIWWLGVPALAFVAWQAYARRSLALGLVAIAFACQWVSWARIDRAAFQYHYYTSLPFVILSLAYFAAEIWHGTSRRIWLLARISAGIAVMGPALLWLFDQPLCGFVGVERVVENSAACPPVIPDFVLTAQTLALAVVVLVAMVVFLYQLASLQIGDDLETSPRQLVPLAVTAVVTLVALFVVRLIEPVEIIRTTSFPVEPIAAVGVVLLGFLAAFVATARDARRFVVGMVTAIVAWFLLLYPNISALPLPSVVANAYQGVLPTYLYAFQFPSNRTAVAGATPLIDGWAAIIGIGVAFLAVVLAYAAWVWRIALAERDADDRAADEAEAAARLASGSSGR